MRQQVQDALHAVTQGFDAQMRQARLKAEYDALLKETKYHDMIQQESADNEWLHGKRSSKLMTLLNLYQLKVENKPKPDIWFRLKWMFSFGTKMFSFLGGNPSCVVAGLESAYYFSRKAEIGQELGDIAKTLQSIDIKRCTAELRSASLLVLKSKMAKRYQTSERARFTIKDMKPRTEEFLKEYPVVLSTTYSAKNCISKDMVFDYVIMDEASQVDIKTGALALIGADMASTVHKYQGRETVDNAPTEFSDDPNLLNVAISRAKTHLCIVTNGNDMPQDTNLAQLIAYIQYNNFEVKESKLHSVFDLLYKQYTAERLAYEQAHHSTVSGYLSENLLFDILGKGIAHLGWTNTEVLCHYPLSRLIADWDALNEQEKAFAESPLAHVDFLIYNSLTKRLLQVIEVDGWHFHKGSEVQQSRDALKDRILAKFGLCPHRISTTDTVNEETIVKMLQAMP